MDKNAYESDGVIVSCRLKPHNAFRGRYESGPCKMMGPVLEELAAAHPTVKVGKLNTDENLKLAMARKIDAIPALLLFRNGQEVSRSVGYKPAAELEAWLRENGAI